MKRSVVVLLHIGYWALYVFLFFVFFVLVAAPQGLLLGKRDPSFWEEWWALMSALAFAPGLVGFYTGYSWLFPKYLVKRRFGMLFLMTLLMLVVAIIFGFCNMLLFLNANLENTNMAMSTVVLSIMTPMAFLYLVNGVIGLVMRGFITSYSDIILKEELNNKNYHMELALVKAQIDPHFLFNTINNIDVLIQKDAEKASAYLNQLSDIMRFMLYETKTDKISLQKELTYIDKYLALQKIRSSNPDFVKFMLSGEPENWNIEPMLFIPFIENAFKHAEHVKTGPAINIAIDAGETLYFECSNRFLEAPEENKIGGLGSGLIKRRLELLYPNRHELSVSNQGGLYSLKLTINPEGK